jgi:hypothetical protein
MSEWETLANAWREFVLTVARELRIDKLCAFLNRLLT